MEARVTAKINHDLLHNFIEADLVEALQQMNPTKALGPDGMAPLFYQKYWHIVGKYVSSTVLKTLDSGQFPHAINHTYITLIPKKKKIL